MIKKIALIIILSSAETQNKIIKIKFNTKIIFNRINIYNKRIIYKANLPYKKIRTIKVRLKIF